MVFYAFSIEPKIAPAKSDVVASFAMATVVLRSNQGGLAFSFGFEYAANGSF
jgi:hypothetical protein